MIAAALSARKRECAEQGLDNEEMLDQFAAENCLMEELGPDPLDWTGTIAAASAVSSPEMPQPQ